MEIKVGDLIGIMELRSKRAKLELKREYLRLAGEAELESIDYEIKKTGELLSELSKKLEKAGFELVIPFENKLEELNRQLGGHTSAEILNALESKEGELYSLLIERGAIIKRNFLSRVEIAKLSIVLANLPPDLKSSLKNTVKKGAVEEPLLLNGTEASSYEPLLKLINRVGIPASINEGTLSSSETSHSEVKFEFEGKSVWVSKEKGEKLEKNIERFEELNRKIQLKNAESQIRVFEGEEEKYFRDLQKEYLELLKERDSLLCDFQSEVSLSFKVS